MATRCYAVKGLFVDDGGHIHLDPLGERFDLGGAPFVTVEIELAHRVGVLVLASAARRFCFGIDGCACWHCQHINGR